jgi:NAD(P)-dependent dehydrogenase (short-subunit alcohol dehydrogenase family)
MIGSRVRAPYLLVAGAPIAAGSKEVTVSGELKSIPAEGIALVIGASGGIGAALIRALEDGGRFARVIGLSRSSDPPVDVTDEDSITAALNAVDDPDRPLRLVIDATGFLHDDRFTPEKSWRHLDAEHLAHAFAVNAIGPALLIKHIAARLPRKGKAVVASLSAKVGSIADNRYGGWYAYRASKAALNQIIRTAAIELARKRKDAVCVALHPGTTDTPLSAPFGKEGLYVRSPAESAANLLDTIDRLGPDDTGGFFDDTGAALPW